MNIFRRAFAYGFFCASFVGLMVAPSVAFAQEEVEPPVVETSPGAQGITPAPATKEIIEIRLAKLSALFKMNVAAEAYLNYCDRDGPRPPSPYYVGNTKAVEYMLMKELMRSRGEATSTRSQRSVEARFKQLMQAAYVYYSEKGCGSEKAAAAREHIQKIGTPKTSELLKYLRDIENR